MRVLCWGDLGLDEYAGEATPRPGGCALNVAVSLAAGGADVACAGPIGADGGPLLDLLRARGIDATHVEVQRGATPRQPVRLAPDGERTLSGYRPGVLAAYRPGAAVRAAVRAAGLVYVPVFDVTVPMAEAAWADRPEAPVAVDLMDLTDVDEALAEEAVRRSAVVFAGLHPERHAAWIERLRGWAARPGAAWCVVTLGAAGARAFGAEEVAVHAAPVPGGRVVDTTGCGDAFAGAFLAARARGEEVLAALRAGARRAAEVAAHLGAVDVGSGGGGERWRWGAVEASEDGARPSGPP